MRKSQSIEEIHSQFAHDIRSPLAAMEIIVRTLDSVNSEKRDLLIECSKRVRAIANSLLKPGLRESLCAVNIYNFLEHAIKIKSQEFPSIPIILTTNLGFSKGTEVQIRPGELGRALSNLLNNACEVSSADKPIQIELEVNSRFRQVEIAIKDSGPGIPSEIITRLGHESLSTKDPSNEFGSGSGLGIKSAFEIVQSAHGSISLSSTPLEGTTVLIRLPPSN